MSLKQIHLIGEIIEHLCPGVTLWMLKFIALLMNRSVSLMKKMKDEILSRPPLWPKQSERGSKVSTLTRNILVQQESTAEQLQKYDRTLRV